MVEVRRREPVVRKRYAIDMVIEFERPLPRRPLPADAPPFGA
jgi:hypothetical protein